MKTPMMGRWLRVLIPPPPRLATCLDGDPEHALVHLASLSPKDAARQITGHAEDRGEPPLAVLRSISAYANPTWLHSFAVEILRNPVRSTTEPEVAAALYPMVDLPSLLADCEQRARRCQGTPVPDSIVLELAPLFAHALTTRETGTLKLLASSFLIDQMLGRFLLKSLTRGSEVTPDDFIALLNAGATPTCLAQRSVTLALSTIGNAAFLRNAASVPSLLPILAHELLSRSTALSSNLPVSAMVQEIISRSTEPSCPSL